MPDLTYRDAFAPPVPDDPPPAKPERPLATWQAGLVLLAIGGLPLVLAIVRMMR